MVDEIIFSFTRYENTFCIIILLISNNHVAEMLSESGLFRYWKYESVQNDPDDFNDKGFSNESLSTLGPDALHRSRPCWSTIVNVLFFLLSLWLFVMSIVSYELPCPMTRERNYLLRQTSEPCKSPENKKKQN